MLKEQNMSIAHQCMNVINSKVGEQITLDDLNEIGVYQPTITAYINRGRLNGILKKINKGTFEVVKTAEYPACFTLSPEDLTQYHAQQDKTKFVPEGMRTFTREEMRAELNKVIGSVIDATMFERSKIYGNQFLISLVHSGHVERVRRGKYKVAKEIELVKKTRKRTSNHILKDISVIPRVLNSHDEGLVMNQIYSIYRSLTPPAKQITRHYLVELTGYGISIGVILPNGINKNLRNGNRGPFPKRMILANPDITKEEWAEFINNFRLHKQQSIRHKYARRTKSKTVAEKLEPSEVITTGFGEERNNPHKQFVEDYFLKAIEKNLNGKSIPCFTLTGPDYYRHMQKLFNTIANTVVVAEIKKDVFDTIYNKAKVCPHNINNKVSLLNCNIDDVTATNCYFMDLDLMSNIVTIYNTVLKQIKIQSDSCNNNKLKYLSFTASRRNDKGENNRLKKLTKLLYEGFEARLDGFHGGPGFGEGIKVAQSSKQLRSCKQHIPDITHYGRIKELHVFTYQDCGPMMSFLITYK